MKSLGRLSSTSSSICSTDPIQAVSRTLEETVHLMPSCFETWKLRKVDCCFRRWLNDVREFEPTPSQLQVLVAVGGYNQSESACLTLSQLRIFTNVHVVRRFPARGSVRRLSVLRRNGTRAPVPCRAWVPYRAGSDRRPCRTSASCMSAVR